MLLWDWTCGVWNMVFWAQSQPSDEGTKRASGHARKNRSKSRMEVSVASRRLTSDTRVLEGDVKGRSSREYDILRTSTTFISSTATSVGVDHRDRLDKKGVGGERGRQKGVTELLGTGKTETGKSSRVDERSLTGTHRATINFGRNQGGHHGSWPREPGGRHRGGWSVR